MLDKIKIRLGIEDESRDLILNDLINDSIDDVKEYTGNKNLEINSTVERIIKELVIIKFNRIGAEGLISENVEGVAQNYIDGLPKDLISKLNRLRRVSWRH